MNLLEERVKPDELPDISPSSINLFLKDRALWVLKHFYGETSHFNIHAMRGVAIEEGLNYYVAHPEDKDRLEKAIDIAMTDFGEKAFFWGDNDLLESIEAVIPDWVGVGAGALDSVLSDAVCAQERVSVRLKDKGLEDLTLTGYVDYTTPTRRIDLKTSTTLPKAVSRGARKGFLPASKRDNVRQQAVYNMVDDKQVSLLYVSPEGFYHHEISQEEIDEQLPSIKEAVIDMKKLLTSQIEDVIKDSVPNWKAMRSSFYWDDRLRELADKLWADFKPEEELF